MKLIFLYTLLLFPSLSVAVGENPSGMRYSYSQQIQRSHFSLGSELTSLISETSSLMGFGPRAGFEYGLTDRVSLGSNVVFAVQASGKPGAFFYSGITGLVRYAFQGSLLKSSGVLAKNDGGTVFAIRPTGQKRITGLMGVDQLFLNGVASIYPAVGLTMGGSYGTMILGREAEFDLRYSMMTANDNPISMIAFGAHFNLDF